MTEHGQLYEGWEPHRPPWYPRDDNPWQIISTMSGNVVTNYSKWCDSLPPGELKRLIREYRDSVERGEVADA